MPATLTPATVSPQNLHDDKNAAPTAAAPIAHTVDSSALLQGQKAITISHNGSAYRLQSTKLGKLILTK